MGFAGNHVLGIQAENASWNLGSKKSTSGVRPKSPADTRARDSRSAASSPENTRQNRTIPLNAAAAGSPSAAPTSVEAVQTSMATTATPWLSIANGKLSYHKDSQGNRIPDFSQVGYHAGDASIPAVAVKQTVAAKAAGDDTARIQKAIDAVGATGKPGAVLLGAGTFRLSGTLALDYSGVVLRGSGRTGSTQTMLRGTGGPHTLINVGASAGAPVRVGSKLAVKDSYVPVGAISLNVTGAAAGLKAGDTVIVQRPQEANWITALGMDKIPARADGSPISQWTAGAGQQFERTVRAVSGTKVTLDVPLTNALESTYTHATVWKYTFAQRISEAGVENLAANGSAMEADASWLDGGYFASGLVNVDRAQNSWVRNVTATRFGSAFNLGPQALRVSLLKTWSLNESVPQDITAQPAAYTNSGQQNLVSGCRVTGSNLHAWTQQARVPGPNVFTDCSATNTGTRIFDAGPHQRWSSGTLYDRMTTTGKILLVDRGAAGSGQGWAGANDVMYNCGTGSYLVENPPTAHNWAIGNTGTKSAAPAGHVLGEYQDANSALPASLYLEQLTERQAAG